MKKLEYNHLPSFFQKIINGTECTKTSANLPSAVKKQL